LVLLRWKSSIEATVARRWRKHHIHVCDLEVVDSAIITEGLEHGLSGNQVELVGCVTGAALLDTKVRSITSTLIAVHANIIQGAPIF
jgi:hypothetical protein